MFLPYAPVESQGTTGKEQKKKPDSDQEPHRER
jgi:hypothetical protein